MANKDQFQDQDQVTGGENVPLELCRLVKEADRALEERVVWMVLNIGVDAERAVPDHVHGVKLQEAVKEEVERNQTV